MTPEEQQNLQQHLQAISQILGNQTSDKLAHEISSQDVCLEIISPAQNDPRWYQGLSLQIDQEILQGKIIAYQIRWFNGNWSHWFVPGINDIDWKYNPSTHQMRRVWSYFNDHEHKYIMCKPATIQAESPELITSKESIKNSQSISSQAFTAIRQFYENTFLVEMRQAWKDGQLDDWRHDSQRCLGYLEIGSLELDHNEVEYNPRLDFVKVKPLPTNIPSSVIASFNHHYITSQTRLADVHVFRVLVNNENTYAITIDGYVDDGWDQSTEFLEVYNSQGEIVGSCRGFLDDQYEIEWEKRPFSIEDYEFNYEEIQVWSDQDVEYIED